MEKYMETTSTVNNNPTDGFVEYKRHILESTVQSRTMMRMVETNAHIVDAMAQMKAKVDVLCATLDSEAQYAIQLKSEIQYLRDEIEFWKSIALNRKQTDTPHDTRNGGVYGG
jgi:hypothetical protein